MLFAIIAPLAQETIHDHEASHTAPTIGETWGYSMLTVTIVTLLSMVGIVLVPLLGKHTKVYHYFMTLSIALASGVMIGDAILHLLPQAFGVHASHGESEPIQISTVWIGMITLSAILLFFLLEKFLQMYHHGHSHSHHHSHNHSHTHTIAPATQSPPEITATNQSNFTHSNIDPIGWSILVGDSLHNFIDGIAIGASFASSTTTGIATAIAVILHELPHEIGDYAILLSAGFSYKRAAIYNGISNLTAYGGVIVGILAIKENESSVRLLLAFTAGVFLYIGLADLVPELQKDSSHVPHEEEEGVETKLNGMWRIGLISLFMMIGFWITLLIAIFEESTH